MDYLSAFIIWLLDTLEDDEVDYLKRVIEHDLIHNILPSSKTSKSLHIFLEFTQTRTQSEIAHTIKSIEEYINQDHLF